MNVPKNKLPPIKKLIVYLDQFALSEMAKSLHPETQHKIDPYWKKLFGKLDRLCKLQVIVCPSSGFHDVESRMSAEHYAKIRRVNNQLSSGISFRDDHEIQRIQVLEFAHCWLHQELKSDEIQLNKQIVFRNNPHEWQSEFNIDFNLQYSEDWKKRVREIQQETVDNFRILLERRWKMQKGMTSKAFFKAVALEEASEYGRVALMLYKEYVQRLTANREVNNVVGDLALMPTPSFQLVEVLFKYFLDHGVKPDDLAKTVHDYLLSPLMISIPFNDIAGLMHAAVARKYCAGRDECPSRKGASIFTDISMISTLLPYCDAMMVDSLCFEFLSEPDIKQQLKYDTKLFSPKKRVDFLIYLDGLDKAISPKHIELVRTVYGEGWEEPYYTMFKAK